MSGLNDEQFSRFEALSGKAELDDAEMAELEQLDGMTREAEPQAVAPSWGFTAEDISTEVATTRAAEAEAQRTARNTRLRLAFDESRRTSDDDATKTVAIARQLKVPFDTVRQNLKAFEETAAAAKYDPDAWAAEHPELAKLITENPDLGPLVMRSKEAGPIVKAIRSAGDWLHDALGIMSKQDIAAEEQFAAQFADDPDAALKRGETLEQDARVREELARAKRDAPQQVLELDDAKARSLRDDSSFASTALVVWQRAAEAKRSLDLSRQQVKLMLAENGFESAGDPAELAAELADAKLAATPRAFGDDSGVLRDVTEALQGAVSTVDVAGDALRGAGAGATVGFVAGAGVTGAITRSPTLALEAGMAGARMLGGKGASAAAFLSATQLETGASYESLREEVTDADQKLTPAEAMGGAVIQGLAKGALEVISLGQQGKVLKQALPGQITGLLKRDPTFRALVGRVAIEYGKSVATEGFTEGLQDAVEQVGSYISTSLKDEALQQGDVINLDRTAQAIQGGVLGAALSGGITSGLALATTRRAEAGAEVSQRAVAPLLQLSEQPAVKAAPQEFAQLVAEATGENGTPLTSLHVDAAAIVRFFQERGDDADTTNAALVELVGPDAPTQLAEAVAAGGKLEVPMAAVLSKWGTSEVGKALVNHTATDANALTPEQQKAQQAEIEARAESIVQESEAATREAEQLVERTQALEKQLLDAGVGKQQAKAGAALVRAFMVTQAKDFDTAVSELFPEAPISVEKGDEASVSADQRLNQEQTDVERQGLAEQLLKTAQDMEAKPGGRAAAFMDNLTGLRNLRGFRLLPLGEGQLVAAITSTDTKPLNDNPKLGHEQANRMLKALGRLVASIDPDGARGGTNFVFRAESAEQVQQAVDAWRKTLSPEIADQLNVSVGFGESLDDAIGSLEEQVDTGRAKGRAAEGIAAEPLDATLISEFPNAAQLPASRLGTALDLNAMAANPAALAAGDVMARTGEVPQDPQEEATRAFATTADFAVDQLMDAQSAPAGMEPLIFNKRGFEAAGPRAWTMAFDGIGLKALNARFAELGRQVGMSRREASAWGKKQGDILFKVIAQAAHEMGGASVVFSRLSGDEFAAKSDDQAALLQFGADLLAAVEEISAGLSVRVNEATELKVDVGIRWGLGDTYETADQNLNARKEGKRGTGPGGDVELPGRGSADERARRAERRGTLPATGIRLAQTRAGRAQEVTRVEQEDGAAPKGYTSLPAGRALQSTIRVFLNKSADVSTVLHEAGHAFLEQLGDLAERPDAPQRTKDTYAAALKALGVESRREVKREQHEKFARAFERYAFEGQAPSGELKRVFARFTSWLVGIYRTLAGIPGAELSAELKPVFDAMLATDDQLTAMRRKQGPQLTAEQLQVKQAERQAQLEQEADEYREGSHAAQLAAVKDALRLREAWWKKGLKKLEANFADEYEQLPARRAQRLLSGEETGEPIVLDRALVEEVIGELRVPGLKTAETGGVRPSFVAEMAGYVSPRAMLAELAGLRSRETWARAQADAEMRRLHPGILDDLKKFRAMLSDGLRSATEKRLMREVAGLEREALKRAAAKMVERRKVGKLEPGKALALQRQGANAKARAMAKGDAVAVRQAATAELLNHYLHGELTKAVAEVEKVEALAKRLGKTSARERLGKASPAYRDAVVFIRGELGFGEPTDIDDAALEAAVGQLEGDAVTIGDPDWLAPLRAAIAKTGDYRELTVAELGAVRDALKMLETGARNRTEVLVDGKRVDFEQAKAEVLKEIASTLPKKGPVVSESAKTFIEKAKSRISALDGFLLSPVDLVRELVGDNQTSTLWRVLVLPMRRAMSFEADLVKQRLEPILKAFEAMPPSMRAALNDTINGEALFPDHIKELAAPRRRFELLGLALNAGSESSLEVLLAGRGITLEQMTSALNLLTAEEISWVNAVHESIEQMREPAFALEERLTGIRPQAVEARPLQLRNGRLNGGYFPLKAEPGVSNVGRRAFGADQLASLTDPTFTRPGTAHGHLKSRTGAFYPVALDPDVLRQHIRQSAHDIAFREVVQSAGRMVLDQDVQAALTERLGQEKTGQFLPWLKDIGGGRGVETNTMLQLFRFLKGNAATALLSGASTAIGNLANLPAAVASTKLKSKHLAAGLAEMMRSPKEAKARALALSGVLRSMENDTIAGLEKELASMHGGRLTRTNALMKEIGMWTMRTIDGVVSSAVWVGAHRQALAEGMEAGAAVRWADDLLLQVQPSSSPAEKAGILRDKGVIGAMTMFYGYLSVAYRANHRLAAPLFTQAFRDASGVKKAAIAGAVAGQMLGFWLAFGAFGDLLMGRGPEAGDADDEEPDNELLKWRNWVTRKLLVAPLSLIPVLPVANQVEARILHKRPTTRADPMSQLVVQLGEFMDAAMKAADEDAPDGAARKAGGKALRLLGTLTGTPVRMGEVPLTYFWDLGTGAQQPQNPGQVVGGLVYGARDDQPINVPTALGDALFGTE